MTFVALTKTDGKTVWVNAATIATIQRVDVQQGRSITTEVTLTTTTSMHGPNGEPYQEHTTLKVVESPQQIVDRIPTP